MSKDDSAQSNATEIRGRIDSLPESPHFRDFWQQVKIINGLFKTHKPLSREDREHLWSLMGNKCERMKAEQEREGIRREQHSKEKRVEVEGRIRQARSLINGTDEARDLKKANAILEEALRWMRDGWDEANTATSVAASIGLVGSGRMLKGDSDACWDLWKETKDLRVHKREQIWDSNYAVFDQKVVEVSDLAVYGDAKEAKERIKSINTEMKGVSFREAHFREIRSSLDRYWEKATERLKERYEEGRRKHLEWQQRMLQHVERWTELRSKNEQIISKIGADIDRCVGLLATAKGEDFADRVRGWIDEKREKIADIEATNAELASKIVDVRVRLNE